MVPDDTDEHIPLDSAILLDEWGRPYEVGVCMAPGHIVPPMPPSARPRSGKWPAFLHGLLKGSPPCIGCGRPAETGHHIKPFHEHPELELVEDNIALVDVPCHFVLAHAGDWRLTVENCLERLARNLKDMPRIRRHS